MTDNETLRAFVDCEALPRGRNVSELLSPQSYRQMREYVQWYDDLVEAKKRTEEEESAPEREELQGASATAHTNLWSMSVNLAGNGCYCLQVATQARGKI